MLSYSLLKTNTEVSVAAMNLHKMATQLHSRTSHSHNHSPLSVLLATLCVLMKIEIEIGITYITIWLQLIPSYSPEVQCLIDLRF